MSHIMITYNFNTISLTSAQNIPPTQYKVHHAILNSKSTNISDD